MSNDKPDISLQSMYERITSTYDKLGKGDVNPEVADRQIKAAETFARFAELELKTMAVAWTHGRDITPGPVMGNLVQPEDMGAATVPSTVRAAGRR